MNSKQEPIHVILADDDEDEQAFFRETLNELSVTVILQTVEDGEKLLRVLSGFEIVPPPHVIFLDINMPRMNGIKCLAEIRTDKKYDNVPVFMFSTSSHPKDIDDTYRNGANLYIPKEFFYSSQKEVIEKLFSFHWSEHLRKKPIEKFVLNKDLLKNRGETQEP